MKSEPLPPDEKLRRIQKALTYAGDYHSLADVIRGLGVGKYQMFDNDDGAIVTEVIQLPGGRYLSAWLAGGRLPGIMDNVRDMENLAREYNCREMIMTGRVGWDKVLPDYGWRKIGVVYARGVTNA